MIVVFQRTGERRYAVEAQRPGRPNLVMNPAPGYDPRVPHDLMHLVVEAQLGLTRGIFGQLAAGGNAGTFQPSTNRDETTREKTRTRKRVAKRGKTLLQQGRKECVESELATWICWCEWLARSSSFENKQQAQAMAKQAREVRQTVNARKLALSQTRLNEICKHLDQLSCYWFRLKVGESMAVRWPDLAIVTGHGPSAA